MVPSLLLLSLLSAIATVQGDTLQSVIQQYGLTAASNNLSFPSTTLNSDDAARWVVEHWSTVVTRLDWGDSNVVFSPDPSTSSSTLVKRQSPSTTITSHSSHSSTTHRSSSLSLSSQTSIASPVSTNLAGQPPVLRIGYPQGSYSGRTGGTQFTSNLTTAVGGAGTGSGQGYERMLLAYDVWFPSGFAWVKGGKLPGLRGGPDRTGCSGGSQPDGTSCFSTRLMWRDRGAGEVYAYIPNVSGLCSQSQVICNSDYGTSLGRSTFSFGTGQWQTIWLMVVLNEVGKANGQVELWYNSVPALSFPQSVLRTTSSLSGITGLFFSTFFGGDDSSWSSPTDQYTYFKNIQLYAGNGAATGNGPSAPTSAVTGSGSGGGGNGAERVTGRMVPGMIMGVGLSVLVGWAVLMV